MIRGLYTAASGMISERRRQQILSNNLNNMDTPGYKQSTNKLRTFPEMLTQRIGGDTPIANIGDVPTGVYDEETIPDFSQGTISDTGKKTDVALVTSQLPLNPRTGSQEGALFFGVRTAAGAVRYTRDGHFTLNAAGQLTDDGGDRVLDQAGNPIQLNSDNIQIAGDGTVTDAGSGARLGQIGVSYAANPDRLVKSGSGGFFRLQGGGALPSATGQAGVAYQLKQGSLEGSNVSADETVTNMMESYRSFEANQKVLQILDGTLDKAVNDVGRVTG
ncbi:MAG: flagellar hook-basal body protein [Sporolactobacillus sp.]